ncbi:Enzymatic polyprotein [Glycine max]|nr:Enzymatic polyprotein [Glycine max]
MSTTNGSKLKINYKLSSTIIENQGLRIETNFLLVKNLKNEVILGTPFITSLLPLQISKEGITTTDLGRKITFNISTKPISRNINFLEKKISQINFLKEEVSFNNIQIQLEKPQLKEKIQSLLQHIQSTICSDSPHAFWNRKKHILDLPYERDFREKQIPTKARPIQMNEELLQYYQKDIKDLLDKDLTRKSKSPRLRKIPPPSSDIYTQVVKDIKLKVQSIKCPYLPVSQTFKIVETDTSHIGYGGILKQRVNTQENVIAYTSKHWNSGQLKYSTVKKKVLAIVLCISKFQSDLLNQKFLIRIDYKSAKDILQKDVKNIASKQIFARWQAILSSISKALQTLGLTILPMNSYREIPMPPRASGTSLRGGRSTRKGFKLALPKPSPKKSSPSSSGSPTQAGSST